jgi:hypothetical protein
MRLFRITAVDQGGHCAAQGFGTANRFVRTNFAHGCSD